MFNKKTDYFNFYKSEYIPKVLICMVYYKKANNIFIITALLYFLSIV